MKKLAIIAAVLLPAICVGTASAAVSITSLNTPIVLDLSGWAGTLPADFSLSGTTAAVVYRGSSPTTTGGVYSVSGQGFAYLGSQAASALTLNGTWQNNTGATIDSITFSYNAFLVTSNTRDPGWAVSSSLGDASPLNWVSSQGAQTLTTTFTGLALAPGDTFTFSFASDRGTGSGSSPMIGLNDLSVTASAVPEPSTWALMAVTGAIFMFVVRRRASAHI